MTGTKDTVWEMEPHTRAKHELVRQYLGGWFPILGANSGRVVFLDGFAGPGVYRGGEPGSPIIALQTLLDHSHWRRLQGCEFVFEFLEPEADRAERLKRELTRFVSERGGLPGNVKYEVQRSTFEQGATEIIEMLEEQKARLAPTFAFIDPSGFSGVPLELISQLLDFDKCEVFINFMFDFINRFATAGNVDHHLGRVFGCDDYQQARVLSRGERRRQFLHDLYEHQLREVAGFPYVRRFQMFNQQGHNVYSLFFGTRNLRGLKVMKEAMWKVDPGGTYRFSDRLAGQTVLFGKTDVEPLRQAIMWNFAGQTVGVEEIERFTLVNTPYSASHYNRAVLKPLEKEERIEVVSTPRERRYTYPQHTVIRFPS